MFHELTLVHLLPGITLKSVTRDGIRWFGIRDTCDALRIGRPHMALAGLSEGTKASIKTRDKGRRGELWAISEAGLRELAQHVHRKALIQIQQNTRDWPIEVPPTATNHVTSAYALSGTESLPELVAEVHRAQARIAVLKAAIPLEAARDALDVFNAKASCRANPDSIWPCRSLPLTG